MLMLKRGHTAGLKIARVLYRVSIDGLSAPEVCIALTMHNQPHIIDRPLGSCASHPVLLLLQRL